MKRRIGLIILSAVVVSATLLSQSCSKSGGETDDQLHVAVLLPLTGPAASSGAGSQKGFEMALKELQAGGADIKIDYHDTQGNPKNAVSIYQQIMLGSPPDVIISELSGCTMALKPMLTGESLTVSTIVADPKLSDPSKDTRLFRVFLSADGMGKAAADYIETKGYEKTVVVYINDDYGVSCMEAFRRHYEKASNQIIAEPFNLLGKDFRTSWKKLLVAHPEAIFVCGYGPGYMTVLNQLRETGYQGEIITDWSLTDPGYLKAVKGVRKGTKIVSVGWTPEFEASYRELYGATGSYILSGYSHATLELIWEAYTASDKTVDGLAESFSMLRDVQTVMGSISIEPSGGIKALYKIIPVESLQE